MRRGEVLLEFTLLGHLLGGWCSASYEKRKGPFMIYNVGVPFSWVAVDIVEEGEKTL